jgi:hypothetical protein
MTSSTRRAEVRLVRLFRTILPASLFVVPLAPAGCSRTPPTKEAGDAGTLDATVRDPCAPKLGNIVVQSFADGGGDFHYLMQFSCGVPPDIHVGNAACGFGFNDCQTLCSFAGACSCRTVDAGCSNGSVVDAGPVIISCDLDCFSNAGRRPRGLVDPAAARSGNDLGEFFARAAYLEEASIRAFQELSLALSELGAPSDLVAQARNAAEDERRHARTTGRLARRFGGCPSAVRAKAAPASNSLEGMALENAIEGCVRETYGALIATFQARHAQDKRVATAMRRIAADETRHAALAWAIAHWAAPRLAPSARRRVADARCSAARELERVAAEPADELVRLAGLPSHQQQIRLMRGLRQTIWSPNARGVV